MAGRRASGGLRMHSPEYEAMASMCHRVSMLESDGRFRLLSATQQHDPEDTRTPPAPGAIQIGPIDTS